MFVYWLRALVIAILAGLSLWGALVSIFDPKGLPKVKALIYNWTSGGVQLIGDAMGALTPGLAGIGTSVMNALNDHGSQIAQVFKAPAAAFADMIFKEQYDALSTIGESTPDNATFAASLAMGNAFGRGVASAGVAALFEACTPEKLNTLDGIAPMLGEMAGFKEVATQVLDRLYEHGFGKSLDYHYRSLFKPELPDEKDAVTWHSRRLLTDDQLRKVFEFSGLKSEYEEPYVRSAYRAVSPFILGRAVEDVPFPSAQMQDVLEFNGYRDQDISFLLDLFEKMSVKNVRNQYLASLLTAAERGTIDDNTLESHLVSLDFSETAKNYVHLTVSIRRLEQLAELYRKSVSALYETRQLPDAQYVPALEAIGIEQADAEAHYAIDSARLHAKVLAEEERAAEKAAAQLLREQIGAIKAAFMAA